MKRKRKKRKLNTMDIILINLAIFLLLFVITMTVAIWTTGGSFDTLIDRVITCTIGEGGIMGVIKIAKILKGEKISNDEEGQ